MKKKSLAVVLLVVLSLLAFRWWKGTGDDPRLLRTIDSRTTGDFGGTLSVNSDGSEFASGITSRGNELIIWDSNGFLRNRFTKRENSLVDIQLTERSHRGFIRQIVFSPDWDAFVWCRQRLSPLSALGIWWLNGDSEMHSLLPAFARVYSVAVGPHAKQIAFHGFNDETNSLELCVRTNSKLITLAGVPEHDTIRRMALSPDETRLLAIGLSEDIFMWDLANERLTFSIENSAIISNDAGNDTLVFSPDSKRFAIVEDGHGVDDVIRIRNSIDGSIEKEFTVGFQTYCLGFSPDWKWYVINHPIPNTLKLHSLEDGRLVHTFKDPTGHRGQFIDAAFSGDSRRMVTSSLRDRTYKIWDLTDIRSP